MRSTVEQMWCIHSSSALEMMCTIGASPSGAWKGGVSIEYEGVSKGTRHSALSIVNILSLMSVSVIVNAKSRTVDVWIRC